MTGNEKRINARTVATIFARKLGDLGEKIPGLKLKLCSRNYKIYQPVVEDELNQLRTSRSRVEQLEGR